MKSLFTLSKQDDDLQRPAAEALAYPALLRRATRKEENRKENEAERPYYYFLHGAEHAEEEEQQQRVGDLQREIVQNVSVILLAAGGHFSGAVMKGKQVVASRSFHHYVVRKGQGKRQAAHNGRTGAKCNSAGGRIRSAEERKHRECIAKLLNKEWAQYIRDAGTRVFIGAPGMNRLYFSNLPHKYSVGVTVGRVNKDEVQRVWNLITLLN